MAASANPPNGKKGPSPRSPRPSHRGSPLESVPKKATKDRTAPIQTGRGPARAWHMAWTHRFATAHAHPTTHLGSVTVSFAPHSSFHVPWRRWRRAPLERCTRKSVSSSNDAPRRTPSTAVPSSALLSLARPARSASEGTPNARGYSIETPKYAATSPSAMPHLRDFHARTSTHPAKTREERKWNEYHARNAGSLSKTEHLRTLGARRPLGSFGAAPKRSPPRRLREEDLGFRDPEETPSHPSGPSERSPNGFTPDPRVARRATATASSSKGASSPAGLIKFSR